MVLNNGTFSSWQEIVTNTLSKNGNDALQFIYFILVGWFVHPLEWLRDTYYWFGTRWQHEDADTHTAMFVMTGLFCIPAVILIAQCIFFPANFSWRSGDGLHMTEDKILYLHELAKTGFKEGHSEMVLEYVDDYSLDVNYPAPQTGLTFFLCACLSGHRHLVSEMLSRGGDVNVVTHDKDSALYLATFGVLNSLIPDLKLLQELVDAGGNVNCQNAKGFTPLHRAATRGNVAVINWLLQHGADRNLANRFGVYPSDSATNAGHREVTPLLSGDGSGRVVDVMQLRTPIRARLSMHNPEQQRITESLKQLRCVKRKILKLMTP